MLPPVTSRRSGGCGGPCSGRRRTSSAWRRCSSTSRQPQPPRVNVKWWGPSRKDSTPTAGMLVREVLAGRAARVSPLSVLSRPGLRGWPHRGSTTRMPGGHRRWCLPLAASFVPRLRWYSQGWPRGLQFSSFCEILLFSFSKISHRWRFNGNRNRSMSDPDVDARA